MTVNSATDLGLRVPAVGRTENAVVVEGREVARAAGSGAVVAEAGGRGAMCHWNGTGSGEGLMTQKVRTRECPGVTWSNQRSWWGWGRGRGGGAPDAAVRTVAAWEGARETTSVGCGGGDRVGALGWGGYGWGDGGVVECGW